MDVVYDLETYPNCFTYSDVTVDGEVWNQFEISERADDTEELLAHLRKLVVNKHKMIGYNNRGFDYTLIHYIIGEATEAKKLGSEVSISSRQLYNEAQKMFERSEEERRFPVVRDSDVVIPQVDLFLIHHFDNRARSTSLKMLEFNMRSDEIEDLPFEPGRILTHEEMDELLVYNKKDVVETLRFLHYSKDAIELREVLTKQFGFDCTNFNDTKIGKQLFINRLEQVSPGSCYENNGHFRKMRQTKRDEIVIKDCLFDYIDFSRNRPEFEAVHSWLKKQVIRETKGVFSDILEHDLGDVAKYAEMVTKKKKLGNASDCSQYGFEWDEKRKRCLDYYPTEHQINDLKSEHPLGWIEEKELKSPKGAKSYYWCYNLVTTLNVVINGFRYDFGTGGIHGAKQGTFRSTDEKKLVTWDVASYYPNMAIANKVYPEHLGEAFCKVYKDLYEERKRYPKKTPQNEALKLALNGVYGDSNNQYSPLYDPAYTMAITIGGQLLLCMLMGALIDHCDVEIIMANTDGFEYIVDVDKARRAERIVQRWEKVTGLVMEGDVYESMYIRDVNSYIALKGGGTIEQWKEEFIKSKTK